MGNQQKILICISVIIVLICILFAIRVFRSSEADANLHAIRNDLMDIARKAIGYYHKPTILAGGGYSYAALKSDQNGLQKLFATAQNHNGTFKIKDIGANNCLIVQATGKTDFDKDGQLLTLELRVYSDSVRIAVINQ